MKIYSLYWKIKNFVEVFLTQKESPGLLSHRVDSKDFGFSGGEPTSFLDYSIAPDKWIFSQNPFNVCVFASNTMGSSYQEGMRFSVRFLVALARKKGMISGNGFSYLRAGLELATKYGRLPYELMPDEINGMGWNEYSRIPITEEMLKIASQYKAPNYQQIKTGMEALEALNQGYVLLTANRWYSAMNDPAPPAYLLLQWGAVIGGHAWCIAKHEIDFVNPQTFGFEYGDNGKAYVDTLFKGGQYAVYILEKIPNRTDVDRVTSVFEGENVKGEASEIYSIENGLKRHFSSGESFKQSGKKFNLIPDSILAEIREGQEII